MRCKEKHNLEIVWLRPRPRQRQPRFQLECLSCDYESRVHSLPGHGMDRSGYPLDAAQAAEEVMQWVSDNDLEYVDLERKGS